MQYQTKDHIGGNSATAWVPPNAEPHRAFDAERGRANVRLASKERDTLRPSPAWANIAPSNGSTFVMAMGVPNITGALHIGHALDLLLQDVIVRHRSQHGYEIHFPPGTDHAGLNAQWAGERELQRSGQSREALGPEGFEQYMWRWQQKHEQLIMKQMQELGIAAQFDNVVHSLDTERRRLCERAFCLMFERGWAYRGQALLNWCPQCGSCVGTQELERRECVQTLYRVRVRCENDGLELLLGTLHFELLLGATALGLPRSHPQFSRIIGQRVEVPVLGRCLEVVEVADKGTQMDRCLTLVLPSYNADDFDEALKSQQHVPVVYDDHGRIATEHTRFAGITPEACHAAIERELEASGAIVERESYLQGDGHHRLCGALVRPRPGYAWFLRASALSNAAKELLAEEGSRCNDDAWDEQVKAALQTFAGERSESGNRWWEGACLALVRDFSSNRDLIISRQNWWGYRVPIWHCRECTEPSAGDACPSHCRHCGANQFERDSDVLDVLFHSALWALMVGEDEARSPHADCATLGADILEFWLPAAELWAKVLYGRRSIGRALVHGLICDEAGRKMSKSLGNALDLDQVLAQHSRDGLRCALFTAMCGRDGADLIPLHEAALHAGDETTEHLYAQLLKLPLLAQSTKESHQQVQRLTERIDRSLELYRVGDAYDAVRDLCKALFAGELQLDRSDYRSALRALYPFHPTLTHRVADARSLTVALP